MHILVDADACPNVIKQILFRAANRRKILITLFANQPLSIPPSHYIKFFLVTAGGFDAVDDKIVEVVQAGDLVITADIPLASAVLAKQAFALNPRGELYTEENMQQKLTMRNFMSGLRDAGQITGGPPPLNQRDQQAFANLLDSFLTRQNKR